MPKLFDVPELRNTPSAMALRKMTGLPSPVHTAMYSARSHHHTAATGSSTTVVAHSKAPGARARRRHHASAMISATKISGANAAQINPMNIILPFCINAGQADGVCAVSGGAVGSCVLSFCPQAIQACNRVAFACVKDFNNPQGGEVMVKLHPISKVIHLVFPPSFAIGAANVAYAHTTRKYRRKHRCH